MRIHLNFWKILKKCCSLMLSGVYIKFKLSTPVHWISFEIVGTKSIELVSCLLHTLTYGECSNIFFLLQGTAGQEAEAGMEMSALVNYIQPTHFHTFEIADSEYMSSVKVQLFTWIKKKLHLLCDLGIFRKYTIVFLFKDEIAAMNVRRLSRAVQQLYWRSFRWSLSSILFVLSYG